MMTKLLFRGLLFALAGLIAAPGFAEDIDADSASAERVKAAGFLARRSRGTGCILRRIAR